MQSTVHINTYSNKGIIIIFIWDHMMIGIKLIENFKFIKLKIYEKIIMPTKFDYGVFFITPINCLIPINL